MAAWMCSLRSSATEYCVCSMSCKTRGLPWHRCVQATPESWGRGLPPRELGGATPQRVWGRGCPPRELEEGVAPRKLGEGAAPLLKCYRRCMILQCNPLASVPSRVSDALVSEKGSLYSVHRHGGLGMRLVWLHTPLVVVETKCTLENGLCTLNWNGMQSACGMVWGTYLLRVFLQGSSNFELGSLV